MHTIQRWNKASFMYERWSPRILSLLGGLSMERGEEIRKAARAYAMNDEDEELLIRVYNSNTNKFVKWYINNSYE